MIKTVTISTFRYNRGERKGVIVFEGTIFLPNRNCKTWNKLNIDDVDDDMESDIDTIETRSLPGSITKEWQPTVPKPFSFTLR